MGKIKFSNLVLAFIFVVAVTMIVAPDDAHANDTDSALVCTFISPIVEINAPGDTTTWELSPTTSGNIVKTGHVNVRANTGWQLIVYDIDTATEGHMTMWTDSEYGDERLENPVKVSAVDEVALPNSDKRPIITGLPTGRQGLDVNVTFSQNVTSDDKALDDGEIYRIVMAFAGSPIL